MKIIFYSRLFFFNIFFLGEIVYYIELGTFNDLKMGKHEKEYENPNKLFKH